MVCVPRTKDDVEQLAVYVDVWPDVPDREKPTEQNWVAVVAPAGISVNCTFPEGAALPEGAVRLAWKFAAESTVEVGVKAVSVVTVPAVVTVSVAVAEAPKNPASPLKVAVMVCEPRMSDDEEQLAVYVDVWAAVPVKVKPAGLVHVVIGVAVAAPGARSVNCTVPVGVAVPLGKFMVAVKDTGALIIELLLAGAVKEMVGWALLTTC
jgi:hypothetical protein